MAKKAAHLWLILHICGYMYVGLKPIMCCSTLTLIWEEHFISMSLEESVKSSRIAGTEGFIVPEWDIFRRSGHLFFFNSFVLSSLVARILFAKFERIVLHMKSDEPGHCFNSQGILFNPRTDHWRLIVGKVCAELELELEKAYEYCTIKDKNHLQYTYIESKLTF